MLPEYFLLGCVSQRSFAKCWSSSERACFPAAFFGNRIQAMHEYLDEAGLMQCEYNVIGTCIGWIDELDVIIAMWFWLFWMHQQKSSPRSRCPSFLLKAVSPEVSKASGGTFDSRGETFRRDRWSSMSQVSKCDTDSPDSPRSMDIVNISTLSAELCCFSEAWTDCRQVGQGCCCWKCRLSRYWEGLQSECKIYCYLWCDANQMLVSATLVLSRVSLSRGTLNMDMRLIPLGFLVPRSVLVCAFNTQLICAISPVQHVSVAMKRVSDLSVRRAFIVFKESVTLTTLVSYGKFICA